MAVEGTERRFRALVVALVLAALTFASTGPARRRFDALVRFVFPGRTTIEVAPGSTRVPAGAALIIGARLVGGAAPGVMQLEIGEGQGWRTADMNSGSDGRYRYRVDPVMQPFKYRVLAGRVTSPTYSIEVVKE